MIPSLLGGIWLLAFIGLVQPLRMLPLLMFEVAWKALWMIAFGLPQWASGAMPPIFAEDFLNIARRDPDADRDPLVLCLAPLFRGAGGPLALRGSPGRMVPERLRAFARLSPYSGGAEMVPLWPL